MESQNERMYILDLIDQGRISAAEGLELLEAFAGHFSAEAESAAAQDQPQQSEPDSEPDGRDEYARFVGGPASPTQAAPAQAPQAFQSAVDIQHWKRWWTIPFWVGILIMVFGAIFMGQTQQAGSLGFGFFTAALFFALGGLVTVLAWQSRTAPWLHLRIQQAPGEKPERIAFSLPLPLYKASWLLRLLGRRFSELQQADWEQLLEAVGTHITPENPILVKVDEGKMGEKVEIYIG